MSIADDFEQTLVTTGVETLALGFGGGFFVAVGFNGTHGFADSGDGPWSALDTAVAVDDLFGVAYASGRWVAVGSLTGGNPAIITSTSAAGAWVAPSSVPSGSKFYAVAHHDGRWVASGTGRIATTTSPTGTWTSYSVGGVSEDHYAVAYGNGYWVIASSGGIYYTSDPTGVWTNVSFGGVAIDVDYGNGEWLVVGRTTGAGPTYTAVAKTATTATGTWSAATPGGSYTRGLKVCRYLDDTWIVGGENGVSTDPVTLRHAPSIAGTWATVTLPNGNTYPYVAYDGQSFVCYVGTDGNASTTVAYQQAAGDGWGVILS